MKEAKNFLEFYIAMNKYMDTLLDKVLFGIRGNVLL